jgi:serine phosphatase RsbU (regulator of sigma subunit)
MQSESDPATALEKVNSFLAQSIGDRFVTVAVVVLDPATHMVTVVNAGHMPPLLFRRGLGVSDTNSGSTSGLPLGIVEEVQYDSQQLRMQPGDCVILFTDGVPDAQGRKGDQFGMGRIAETIHKDYPYSPSGLGQKVLSAVRDHTAGRRQFDDIALVCFGRIPEPGTS